MGKTLIQNLLQTSPITLLLITGLILMLLDAFKAKKALPWVAGIGLALSSVISFPGIFESWLSNFEAENTGVAFGMIRTDALAQVIHITLSVSGFFTLFFLGDYIKRLEKPVYEIYSILVFAVIGMVLLANSNDLLITFIGLETMSVCLYIMAALFKTDKRSNESGLKYFLLGAFATGFFLYGIALLYGASGSTNYALMNPATMELSPLLYPGVALLMIGFFFKISAFPFHMWTPDVYTGAPTPLAGFMATGSKAATFIALSYFLIKFDFLLADPKVRLVLIVAALASIIYGNIVAAQQKNLKRMLAFSSIAHTGYVLLAACAGRDEGALEAVILYLLIYTLMNLGAFGILGMAEKDFDDVSMESWAGFGRKSPALAAALAIFLFSLAGIPPLAGFMGKYFVFAAAIRADLIIPAIIGIVASVMGAYYYLRVIQTMYFGKSNTPKVTASKSWGPLVGTAVLVALILLLGVYPSPIQEIINEAAKALHSSQSLALGQ